MGRSVGLKKRHSGGSLSTATTSHRSYYDGYGRKIIPNAAILVREYKRTIYACANLNAGLVSSTPLKLYLKTDSSSGRTVLRRGIETRILSKRQKDYLSSLPYLQKTLRSFVEIEEVLIHPVLDILEHANESRHLNGQRLVELSQLYQEITGKAYWLIERDLVFNLPKNLWIIPSQFLRPVKKSGSSNIVDFYELLVQTQSGEPKRYNPEDIIPFLMPNLVAPYIDGTSPLEASFEPNEVANKELSFEGGLLANEGRPDFIITPKGAEEAFGPEEGERLEKEYRYRFTQGRSGGVWVPNEAIQLQQVTLPVRDLARLEISKKAKTDVANDFCVPFAFISGDKLNDRELRAAREFHGVYAGRPRLNRNATVLNDLLVTEYDDTGRLFLAYDDPVPEDQEKKDQKIINFVMNGIYSKNEGRKLDGIYGPSDDPDADRLIAINVSPEIARENRAKEGNDKREGDE